MRVVILVLAACVLFGSFGGVTRAQGDEDELLAHEIKSVLSPPFTYYSVEALQTSLKDVTYTWSIENNGRCDDFRGEGSTATWRHDDEERCPHEAAAHPATIVVEISDGTHTARRVYGGGSAAYDPGSPPWLSRAGPGGFVGGNEEGDDPRDFPMPTIYGEELECPGSAAGAFEPVQAVWQDEDPERFPDQATKQLTAESPTRAHAELDMVVGKMTQLFGVRGSRDKIHYAAELSGAVMAPAVVRWSLTGGSGGTYILGEIDVGELPILGACRTPSPFVRDFDTTTGLAIRHFVVKHPGEYRIVMEIAQKGGPPVSGTQVVVHGRAVDVPEPRVYFVGAIVTDASNTTAQGIATRNREIAADSKAHIPDYFPLKPNGFQTIVRPVERDVRPAIASAYEACSTPVGAFDWCRVNAARMGVESLFASGAWQLGTGGTGGGNPDRTAIVVSVPDMDFLYPPAGSAAGFAASDKTFFVADDVGHRTVAHEFAHTTPKYAWLHEEPACTVDYHNHYGTWGNGFQLSDGASPVRIPQPARGGVMSSGPDGRWIEQCTYWHLLQKIPQLEDPTLVGIRAWLAKNGTFEAAAFLRGMTFEGVPDRAPGGEGRFAVVLRDADGNALAEHRFDHVFEDDNGGARPMIAVTMSVERPEGLASIEMMGESGVLATLNVTAHAPELQIGAPTAGAAWSETAMDVSWSATDADGDAITYGVVMSPDGGASWFDVDFDLNVTSVTIPAAFFGNATHPRIRVTATDGVNSDTEEVVLEDRTPPPIPTPATPTPGSTTTTPTPTTGAAPGDAEKGAPGFAALAALGALAVVAWARRRA